MRLVDLSGPGAPGKLAAFVLRAPADLAGELPTAPRVWDVARIAGLVLTSEVDGGLYVPRPGRLDLE